MSTGQRSRLLSFVPKTSRNNYGTAKIDLSPQDVMPRAQRNSKFAQLPEEILLLITENLWKEGKAHVIRTCRHLHRLLEFTLYTHLSPIDPWDDYSDYKTALLHRTLVGREDLIPCIRSYSGLLLPSPTQPIRNFINRLWNRTGFGSLNQEDTPITDTEAFKNAVFVFSRACNITTLEFTDNHDWTSDPIFEPIRTAVSKMTLVRLHLRSYSQPATVLQGQLELEHLKIGHTGSNDARTALAKTDLPKLKSLKAPLREASSIVPGSPVEELDLTPVYLEWDRLFEDLTLSTKPITKLSVRLWRPWLAKGTRQTLQLISRNLPEIEHLTIIVAGCISDQILLDEIPSLQFLHSVTFRVANLATFPGQDDSPTEDQIDTALSGGPTYQAHALGDWEDHTTRLKTMCPFLVHVEHTPLTEGISCCPSFA